MSATSSSSLGFTPPVRVTAPAYYEIAGVPSAIVTTSTDYRYLLISAGAGGCTGSAVVTGTITVNPSTSASSSLALDKSALRHQRISSSIFRTTGSPVALSVVTPTLIG